jgi:putative zinc finger protein
MADECPSPELLCAFIDSNVTPEEQLFIENHLVRCDACLNIASSVIKSIRGVPDPIPPPVEKNE